MIWTYDLITVPDSNGNLVQYFRRFESSGSTLTKIERDKNGNCQDRFVKGKRGWIGLEDGDLFYAGGRKMNRDTGQEYITICSIDENPTVSILTLNSNRHPQYADLNGYYCLLNGRPVKIKNPEHIALYGITTETIDSYAKKVLAKYGKYRSIGYKSVFYDIMEKFYKDFFGP